MDELRQEVYALRQEVKALWQVVRERMAPYVHEVVAITPVVPEHLPHTEYVLAALQEMGLLAAPLPDSLHPSDEWERMSDEERETARKQLYAMKLEPPLSQIIITNRHRWKS